MNRSLPTHPRPSSLSSSAAPNLGTSQTTLLQQRISEKKNELASLKELQALSAGLADQMAQLEQKLATLSDGAEAVAVVMGNWGSVLGAIGMAGGALGKVAAKDEVEEGRLPQTLVRIPTQSVEPVLQGAAAGEEGE